MEDTLSLSDLGIHERQKVLQHEKQELNAIGALRQVSDLENLSLDSVYDAWIHASRLRYHRNQGKPSAGTLWFQAMAQLARTMHNQLRDSEDEDEPNLPEHPSIFCRADAWHETQFHGLRSATETVIPDEFLALGIVPDFTQHENQLEGDPGVEGLPTLIDVRGSTAAQPEKKAAWESESMEREFDRCKHEIYMSREEMDKLLFSMSEEERRHFHERRKALIAYHEKKDSEANRAREYAILNGLPIPGSTTATTTSTTKTSAPNDDDDDAYRETIRQSIWPVASWPQSKIVECQQQINHIWRDFCATDLDRAEAFLDALMRRVLRLIGRAWSEDVLDSGEYATQTHDREDVTEPISDKLGFTHVPDGVSIEHWTRGHSQLPWKVSEIWVCNDRFVTDMEAFFWEATVQITLLRIASTKRVHPQIHAAIEHSVFEDISDTVAAQCNMAFHQARADEFVSPGEVEMYSRNENCSRRDARSVVSRYRPEVLMDELECIPETLARKELYASCSVMLARAFPTLRRVMRATPTCKIFASNLEGAAASQGAMLVFLGGVLHIADPKRPDADGSRSWTITRGETSDLETMLIYIKFRGQTLPRLTREDLAKRGMTRTVNGVKICETDASTCTFSFGRAGATASSGRSS